MSDKSEYITVRRDELVELIGDMATQLEATTIDSHLDALIAAVPEQERHEALQATVKRQGGTLLFHALFCYNPGNPDVLPPLTEEQFSKVYFTALQTARRVLSAGSGPAIPSAHMLFEGCQEFTANTEEEF